MDDSDSSTSADEDDDALSLWQTLYRDLSLQDVPPLIIDSDGFSDDDDSSFTTTSQDFSEDEMPTYPQIEACNVTKLKITTPMEESQPHSCSINQVKL